MPTGITYPKGDRMVYGTEHVRLDSPRARSVVGDVEVAAAGNVILRVGREHEDGWSQTEHVVLTPDEATTLAHDVLRKLASNPTTGDLVMNPGTILPNGAVVMAASARNAHEWVLLCFRPGYHANDPYVTWKCRRPGDGTDTWGGHYFDAIGPAVADYLTRL